MCLYVSSVSMKRLALFTVLALSLTARAQAAPLSFDAASGNLAASVVFNLSGSTLTVTLTNTSLFDTLVPADVLTGVFFDIDSAPVTLTPGSAVLGAGSSVLWGTTDPGEVVGGEWAYAGYIGASTPGGQDYGISSAGLGVFGAGSFPGTNLSGPVSVNGMQYGIVSAGNIASTGNQAVTGSNPLIDNSVVFTFSVSPNFNPYLITNVAFQYGTSFSEPRLSVPEPSSLLLLALSSVFVAGARRSLRRSAQR